VTILFTQLGKISTHGADLQMSKIKAKLCMEVACGSEARDGLTQILYKVMIRDSKEANFIFMKETVNLLSVHVSLQLLYKFHLACLPCEMTTKCMKL